MPLAWQGVGGWREWCDRTGSVGLAELVAAGLAGCGWLEGGVGEKTESGGLAIELALGVAGNGRVEVGGATALKAFGLWIGLLWACQGIGAGCAWGEDVRERVHSVGLVN